MVQPTCACELDNFNTNIKSSVHTIHYTSDPICHPLFTGSLLASGLQYRSLLDQRTLQQQQKHHHHHHRAAFLAADNTQSGVATPEQAPHGCEGRTILSRDQT